MAKMVELKELAQAAQGIMTVKLWPVWSTTKYAIYRVK